MVQTFLTRRPVAAWAKLWMCLAMVLGVWAPVQAARIKVEKKAPPPPPDLLMDGGRKLSFERMFSSEREVLGKPGFWTRVVDIVAGDPIRHAMVRPYSIVLDSRGRVIVTDPGMRGVHILTLLSTNTSSSSGEARTRTPCARRNAWRSMPKTTCM